MSVKQQNYPFYESEKFTDFKSALEENVKKNPEKIAFRYVENKQDRQLSYKEHLDNVYALGTAIFNAGFHGKHIAMVGENSYEWILSQITVLSTDNVFVPIDKELPLTDLINVINHSDSEMVICTGAFGKCLYENKDKIPGVKLIVCFRPKDELPEGIIDGWTFVEHGKKLVEDGNVEFIVFSPEENSLGEIVYTSGTTGDPKGVMLSRHNLYSSVYYGLMTMTVFDRCLSVLPYNHTYESTCDLLVSQRMGSTICINESLKAVTNNLKKYKPEYIMLVPLFVESFYKKIMKALEKDGKVDSLRKMIAFSNGLRKIGIDLRKTLFSQLLDVFGGNLIMIVCGGAPIRPELAEFFDGIGISLINGYGITECSPLLSANRLKYNNYKSVGVPLPCVQVRIEDPNEDGEGEIVVKGDIVMMGYYKNEEATKEVLSKDGWFSTGDFGKMVGDQIFITGRKKNLIVLKNGKNVYPEEIEDYISGLAGVEELIVYAEKDENGDEIGLCAEVYPNDEFRAKFESSEMEKNFKKAFIDALRPLPAYKQVSLVVIRDKEFPKTTSKKIKRHEVLKERYGK